MHRRLHTIQGLLSTQLECRLLEAPAAFEGFMTISCFRFCDSTAEESSLAVRGFKATPCRLTSLQTESAAPGWRSAEREGA